MQFKDSAHEFLQNSVHDVKPQSCNEKQYWQLFDYVTKISKLQETCHSIISFQLALADLIISSLYDKGNSVKEKKAEKVC